MRDLEKSVREFFKVWDSQPITMVGDSVKAMREALKVMESNVSDHKLAEQAEHEPVARHICNLWVDPITKEYVVDHCDHPIEELIPAYSTSQYLSKKPDYWLGYGLQAYTQKPFEGATPLYVTPVCTKDLTDDEVVDVMNKIYGPMWTEQDRDFARAVIAKDREKNK